MRARFGLIALWMGAVLGCSGTGQSQGTSLTPGRCAENNGGCDPNAICYDTDGGALCQCVAGYTGDGMFCFAVMPDAGAAMDAGTVDAGARDAGIHDAGTVDAGPADAGPDDAGSVDAGPDDAGFLDAGPVDAGPMDAGPVDAGPIDAGTPSTLQSNTISGQLQLDPAELQWRGLTSWTAPGPCTNGQAGDGTAYDADGGSFPFTPPCLDGDSVAMEDQIRQFNGGGPLASGVTSSWDGSYAATKVDLVNTQLGLLGVTTDPSGLLVPSASIIALPPNPTAQQMTHLPAFNGSGTSAAPIYVVSQAFMRHLAAVVARVNTTMTYDSMMSQGVALVHVVASDGATPVAGRQLSIQWNTPEPQVENMFNGNEGLGALASTTQTNAAFAPYAYYLSSDLNGVMNYANGAVSTSSSGLVIIIAPAPVLYTSSGSTYETAYTANGDWGPMMVFGGQPGAVVDVFLPDQ